MGRIRASGTPRWLRRREDPNRRFHRSRGHSLLPKHGWSAPKLQLKPPLPPGCPLSLLSTPRLTFTNTLHPNPTWHRGPRPNPRRRAVPLVHPPPQKPYPRSQRRKATNRAASVKTPRICPPQTTYPQTPPPPTLHFGSATSLHRARLSSQARRAP